LLLRKLLIMACGLLNTSTPFRGWYLSSLVIILSLTAHAFARPYIDPWVDMTELISLWSTLFIFQGGMVWTSAPDSDLAHLIEVMAIVLVTGTAGLALYVEYRVYRRRHDVGDDVAPKIQEQDFDESVDSNPLYQSSLVVVTFSMSEKPLDLEFEQGKGTDEIKLAGLGAKHQDQHPELCPGLVLVEAGDMSGESLDLARVQQLLSEKDETSHLTMKFRSEARTGAVGDAIAVMDTIDRVQLHQSLSVTSLITDLV
jgi:hypothetical protein